MKTCFARDLSRKVTERDLAPSAQANHHLTVVKSLSESFHGDLFTFFNLVDNSVLCFPFSPTQHTISFETILTKRC